MITEPPTTNPSEIAKPATEGRTALREAYERSTLRGDSPLASAVRT